MNKGRKYSAGSLRRLPEDWNRGSVGHQLQRGETKCGVWEPWVNSIGERLKDSGDAVKKECTSALDGQGNGKISAFTYSTPTREWAILK